MQFESNPNFFYELNKLILKVASKKNQSNTEKD